MRGVPVSLILGIFVILTSGAADAHWSGRGGYGHRQDSDGRCHRQAVVGHCPRQEVDGHGARQVSTGVSCRQRFGWRLFCSGNWREHATTCCSAEATIKELHEKIKQLQARLDEGATKLTEADVKKKEADLRIEEANAKAKNADEKTKGAQEALEVAGQILSKASTAQQDAQTKLADANAKLTEANAKTAAAEKLQATVKDQQDALLRYAEDAKHAQERFAAQLHARWEQIFVNLRGVDPCKLASVPAGKTSLDNTAPQAETNVAAGTESGKGGGMDRTKTEPDAAGTGSTGMSERSRAALE